MFVTPQMGKSSETDAGHPCLIYTAKCIFTQLEPLPSNAPPVFSYVITFNYAYDVPYEACHITCSGTDVIHPLIQGAGQTWNLADIQAQSALHIATQLQEMFLSSDPLGSSASFWGQKLFAGKISSGGKCRKKQSQNK